MINFGRTNTNQLALWWRNIDKLLFILVISLMLLGIFFAYSSNKDKEVKIKKLKKANKMCFAIKR